MVATINNTAAEVTVCSRDGLRSSRSRRKKLTCCVRADGLSAIKGDSILQAGRDWVFASYLLRHTVLLVHLAIFHDEGDGFQRGDILQRIAGDGNDVSKLARFERAN